MSKDPTRALALMERGGELGDALSCAVRAARLERDDPSAASLARAEALYRQACELGNPDGCAGVAYLYEGVQHGPPADPALSARFFARACALGTQDVCDPR